MVHNVVRSSSIFPVCWSSLVWMRMMRQACLKTNLQVEKQIQRVCHSIMGLDAAPDAFRAFIFVTGSYLRGKQETGNRVLQAS